MTNFLLSYTLHLADNAHILGHRLGEWCGHGPVLEQDLAMTNIALDCVGQARSFYQYAAEIEGKGRNEDDMAYLRDAWDFKNVLLVEQENGNFAQTVARQFFYDVYSTLFYAELCKSKEARLAEIAEKSLKETTYHLRWSSEWMLRLGDGTAESHNRLQHAIEELWSFTGELFEMTETEKALLADGISVDLPKLKPLWDKKVAEVLFEATLQKPSSNWMQTGGKMGKHSEYMGYILADMQFMQRAYPNANW